MTASLSATNDALKGHYTQTALVLQGGGALGAYQAGVYQAMSESGCEPDWLSGISIGAINSAIIAGNEPEMRLPRLRQFWEQSTSSFPCTPADFGDDMRRMFNQMSGLSCALTGQPGFFSPRFPPAFLRPHGAPGALSIYDTSPLRATLEHLIDFDRINAGKTRLSLGAVNIRLGNFVYFDSTERNITAEHVMASAALPPSFPPIEIEGEYYWDGGLVSNTPLVHLLDTVLKEDTLAFQVDLFSARGNIPGDLLEVEERRKHICLLQSHTSQHGQLPGKAPAAPGHRGIVRAAATRSEAERGYPQAPRSRRRPRHRHRPSHLPARELRGPGHRL